MPTHSKLQQETASTVLPQSTYKYKDDEIRWDAVYQSSKYISKGFHCDEVIIDPPPNFDGADGTYQVSFENENHVIVLKTAPNPVLSDPHSINSFYAKYYGVMTADDSATRVADKWYTFRYHLDCPGKPSEDLGAIPWLDYADFASEGRKFPWIILNISSIRPIEERAKKMSARLVKKVFVSPPGTNMAGNKTAQMASLLDNMISSGELTEDMKKAMRKFASIQDMETKSDEQQNKRGRKGTSGIPSPTSGSPKDFFDPML